MKTKASAKCEALRHFLIENQMSYSSHASYTSYRQMAKREAHTHTTTNKTNNERNNNMKLEVNWKELARQLWAAVRPVSVETKVK